MLVTTVTVNAPKQERELVLDVPWNLQGLLRLDDVMSEYPDATSFVVVIVKKKS